ncbi:MAG: serine protease [Candidatus Electrothrix sp. ATG2]|nr:serine protease [Candidatus Electrothrix sp. ATG2]
MKRCFLFLQIIALLVYPQLVSAGESRGQYALSKAATRQAVCQWLDQNAYSYQILSEPGGVLRFQSSKRSTASWRLELRPHSPLATSVGVYPEGGEEKAAKLKELPPYLETVEAGGEAVSETASQAGGEMVSETASETVSKTVSETTTGGRQQQVRIPDPVLERIGSVVCVRAEVQGETLQFSGVFIEKGMVLCTAHDLGATEKVSVVSTMGVHFKGDITRIDPQRDLALIQIENGPDQVVALAEGRNLIGMGERIFSIGCPVNLRGTVNSGFINGPPRRMKGLPLWRADIEIQPGSSGSPVFDSNGVLVALVKGRHRISQGIGFLIPLEVITDFLQEKGAE